VGTAGASFKRTKQVYVVARSRHTPVFLFEKVVHLQLSTLPLKTSMQLLDPHFHDIFQLIQAARETTFAQVNQQLVRLYWQIGRYISQKTAKEAWGKSTVQYLADYLAAQDATLQGFTARNLWRMKSFYETYAPYPKLTTLLSEIQWSAHLHILAQTKTIEEKEFYLRLSSQERYSVRELERQLKSGVYERTMLADAKQPLAIQKLPQDTKGIFKEQYIFEFLHLPKPYSEKDLRKGLISQLKDFILEIGKDFTFVGEEYRLQVGEHDFYIDLLLFHRELACLVAIELKIEAFAPAQLGQLNFYLEALNRDVKKKHENPSIGILLCKNKDAEVVEYAMSQSLSPMLIAEYETKLVNKKLLQKKLHDLFGMVKIHDDI
jgi:predicted nuclease of restriction endonuclease-like (RecB) superfamily